MVDRNVARLCLSVPLCGAFSDFSVRVDTPVARIARRYPRRPLFGDFVVAWYRHSTGL